MLKLTPPERTDARGSSDARADRALSALVTALEVTVFWFTVSAEAVGSWIRRLSHHRVVSDKRSDAQTHPCGRARARRICDAVLIDALGAGSDEHEALGGVFISIMVSLERACCLNERLSHHSMARGQRINAQTPVPKAVRVP